MSESNAESTSIAHRRLRLLHSHLLTSPPANHLRSIVETNHTAGEFFIDQGYSVVLPEKLHAGKWNVYRSAHSPLKLVTTFPDHPEIETLHDNFLHAVKVIQITSTWAHGFLWIAQLESTNG